MNHRSKYIIIDAGSWYVPVVFGDMATHSDVACGLSARNIVGAGFCYINKDGHYQCYGESISLKVKSREEEDAKILNKYLGVIHEEY